jgi:hypothetical protein
MNKYTKEELFTQFEQRVRFSDDTFMDLLRQSYTQILDSVDDIYHDQSTMFLTLLQAWMTAQKPFIAPEVAALIEQLEETKKNRRSGNSEEMLLFFLREQLSELQISEELLADYFVYTFLVQQLSPFAE